MQQHFFLGHSALGFHRVAYIEWGRASARPPVICVHGLTRNGRDFDRLAETLKNETQIFCPDMVGRGQSDWLGDPALYGYPQYINDTTALIARTGKEQVDWVGTSMGGILGMLIASMPNSPIRRLVINDVGPFIPVAALKRIGEYVSLMPEFNGVEQLERHLRQVYAPFGALTDADWKHLAAHSHRTLPNGKLTLAHDPSIGKSFLALEQDVDFWDLYDRIQCPVLLLRGTMSDILSAETAQEMTRRGPKAELMEFPHTGHAPALMDVTQINVIAEFLRS
ncbi:MAG: alpha/beta hydrolase [Alphaproteobacteria bacterium]|nr:alpha/beta hydrolase [Alphaproteobacteria bacterium]